MFRWLQLTLCTLVLASIGCSSDPEAEVSGKIVMNGQPFSHAQIQFLPDGDELKRQAYAGKSNEAGIYTLLARDDKGIQAGKYVVIVEKMVKEDGNAPAPGEDPASLDLTNIVPGKYAERELRAIVVEVKKGKNEIPIEIQSE